MPDLTRFDFNAKNFLTSETVRRMADAEVGQYVLLLAEAWLCGKDVTLPDDLPYLARLAHTDKLSDRVLEKFPVVETEFGPRRRNDVLYGEWQEAQHRSEQGREKAERRWGRDKSEPEDESPASRINARAHAPALLLHSPGNATGHAQTVPNQTKPNHNQTNLETSGHTDFQPKAAAESDWANLRRNYRNAFGKKPDKTRFARKYAESCGTYGEEIVLACFDQWATSVGDVVKGFDHPLHSFFKKLPELAADELESQAEEKSLAVQAAAAEQQRTDEQRIVEANIEQQRKKDVEFFTSAPPPENGGSVLDYLSDIK